MAAEHKKIVDLHQWRMRSKAKARTKVIPLHPTADIEIRPRQPSRGSSLKSPHSMPEQGRGWRDWMAHALARVKDRITTAGYKQRHRARRARK